MNNVFNKMQMLKSSDVCNKFSTSVSHETLVDGTATTGREYKQTRLLSKGCADKPLSAVGTLTSLLCNFAKVVDYLLNNLHILYKTSISTAIMVMNLSICYATTIDSGTCGSDCHWTLDENGKLSITGSGEMDDYTDFKDPDTGDWTSTAPWNMGHERAQRIKSVVIGDEITSIGKAAFEFNRNLKSVYMPNVEKIGIGAFYYNDLTSVDMPKVSFIGAWAFQGNANLTYVNMQENVEIGNGAFTYVERDFTQEDYPHVGPRYPIINLDECKVLNGQKICGSCGNDYVMNGLGCVKDCGVGYLGKNGKCVDASLGCGEGYRQFENFCNRIRYTPAEAAEVLRDDNTNEVVITFKK